MHHMPAEILQLTDLHLMADPDAALKGVRTRESLIEVLRFIRDREKAGEWDFDYIILTGDLAHDERLATYETLRELLGDLVSRCRLIPGNHDDRVLIRRVFPELVSTSEEFINFSVATAGWRLIGLDSHVEGEVYGRIDPIQLQWLAAELSTHAVEPTILFIHHPPFSVEAAWLDEIGLQEPEHLRELVANSPQVKIISAGHVHHEFAGRLGHAVVYTTPSTGVQFVPAGDEPVYDPVPPGYRLFVLDGGEFQTEIVRLPQVKYPPVGES